jgi:hypothetical protein
MDEYTNEVETFLLTSYLKAGLSALNSAVDVGGCAPVEA